MTISFIVCTYNRCRYIYECLSRLAKNAHTKEWEIVLINNNSTDDTERECTHFRANYPTVNYAYYVETEQGLSAARNRGIREAHGDWFVFLDDDAMVESDYVDHLLHYLSTESMDAFGGKIIPQFEEEEPNWLSSWSMSWVSALDLGNDVKEMKGKQYPIGANMGIARRVMDVVGKVNTALGRTGDNLMGGEEKDIFNRIREKGFRILYLPTISVHHMIPAKRTTHDYIKRLGEGVGQSEKIRTRSMGKGSYLKRIAQEIVKWGGTLLLWCIFATKGQREKGDVLVMFRSKVSKCLICK